MSQHAVRQVEKNERVVHRSENPQPKYLSTQKDRYTSASGNGLLQKEYGILVRYRVSPHTMTD